MGEATLERGPLISIGMPVFNAAGSLRAAVSSILQQDFADWELLLIDDGSTDDTLELARSFDDARIRVLADGKNRGLAARLNEAVVQSRGEFFARMDGDDIAFPDRLSAQLAYLRAHPEVDLAGGWALVFDSSLGLRGKRTTPESHEAICAAPWSGFPILHPAYMARTDWFRRHPYDEHLPKAQDQALLAAGCTGSRYANVQQVVLAYREDAPSLAKLWASRRCMLRGLLRAYLSQGHPGWAVRAVAAQGVRMLADLVATLLPLRRTQLKMRSGEASPADQQNWQQLLDSVDTVGRSHD